MVIFRLAPDHTIAQMWSNGARGGKGLCTALLGSTVLSIPHTETGRRLHKLRQTDRQHHQEVGLKNSIQDELLTNINIYKWKHKTASFGKTDAN